MALTKDEFLEELADIVIRALDLAVALDLPLADFTTMKKPWERLEFAIDGPHIRDENRPLVLLGLHDAATVITRADRRSDHITRNRAIVNLVRVTVSFATVCGSDLWPHVVAKQATNRQRPELHNRRY